MRPEKIRLLAAGARAEEPPAGNQTRTGVVREIAYLGSVSRYVVETDAGETLVVLQQNLDTSAAGALAQRGQQVRLTWRGEDASVLDSKTQEEAK